MRKMRNGDYIVDDIQRTRIQPGEWENFVFKCRDIDPSNTLYYIPQDPGAQAKKATMLFLRELISKGLAAYKIDTNKSKLERFRPFSAMAQNGGIKFLAGCGTCHENSFFNDLKFVYRELEAFTGERKRGESGHDDIVDACSDAFYTLAVGTVLHGFSAGMKSAMTDFKVRPGVV